MKKILLLVTSISIFSAVSTAQVGIGNATPNSNTILDLTNSNSKSLLLPTPTVDPATLSATTFNTAGMLFYYSNNLYLRTSTGVKAITPWNFDGTAANGLSSPSGTPVGIGTTPLTSSTAILTVADAAGDVNVISSNASIVVGDNDFSATHLLIDEDEIMVKTNATTAGVLKLMEEGGTMEVRSSGADAGITTVVTAYGSVDAKGKIRENGNDLLPVGSIIMWSGASVPAGWALCDGGTYTLDAGGSVTVPNLMDRFIVGADIGGTGTNGTYALNATGGANSVALGVGDLPAHTHTINHGHGVTDPGHTHSFTLGDSGNSCSVADDTGGNVCTYTTTSAVTGVTVNNFAGSSGSVGSGTAHENRPPYFALAFIYKL